MPKISKKSMIIVKKLAFIIKLKKRVKRAERRLNDRKLRILELLDGERNYIKKISGYI